MIRKNEKPADGLTSGGLRIEQVSTTLNLSNTPKLNAPQAADDVGVSDLEYFVRRPTARHRFRAAFPGEFREFVIVIATVDRDDAGQPIATSRSLYRFEGGHA
jgi:hypothetical protein